MPPQRTVAVLRGPTAYFSWDLDDGTTWENSNGTPAAEVEAIITHRPHGDGECHKCRTAWPCRIVKVLEEHCDFIAGIIRYGAKEPTP